MNNDTLFPPLGDADIRELTAFRHELHRYPELSGEEQETARRVCAMLEPTAPDALLEGLGGHGVAAVYDSGLPGPTILVRSELDALPILELGEIDHRSAKPGTAHLCGHDGHSTILVGLGRVLSRQRPPRGRVVLMFQPAEETGQGAAAVVADPRYGEIRPDWAFSLHNMPEIEKGSAELVVGPANCASRGMWIRLTGSTAHASRPGDGLSPMRAMCTLLPALEALGAGQLPEPDFVMVTPTHARLGEPSYGVAPGEAWLQVTLRTADDAHMSDVVQRAEDLAKRTALDNGLAVTIGYEDVFPASVNDADAVDCLAEALARSGIRRITPPGPSVASEDFGRFGKAGARSAMVFLGAGPDSHAVHTPEYDFDDTLIPVGVRIFSEAIAACLDRTGAESGDRLGS